MRLFSEYLEGKTKKYAEKFNPKDLSAQFIPFYENEKRIKVLFPYGEVKSGTIGVTTGWKPVFLLMLTKRSIGSSYLLTDKCKIIL